MADGIEIPDLPAAAPLDGTEQFPVVQDGVTKRTTGLVPTTAKGVPNGVATLDGGGTLTEAQRPPVLNEDDFATNSSTLPPSQRSVAEFADASFVRLGAFVKPVVGTPLPMWPGRAETTGSGVLNRLTLFAVPIPWSVSVDRLGINITTGEADATPRLGLYRPLADGRPGALLVDGGQIDASTTGTKTVTFTPVNLTDGLVYFGVAWQGAATTLRFMRYVQSGGNSYIRVPGGSADGGRWSYDREGVPAALPDPFGSAFAGTSATPHMDIRCAGLL